MRISALCSDVCSSDLWHGGVDRDARMFVDEHRFGKGRKVEHLVDDAAVGPRDARRRAGGAARIAAHAQRHAPRHAKFAMAAKGRQAGDDRDADLHRAHFAADRLDDARGYMAGGSAEKQSELQPLLRTSYAVFRLKT